MAERREFNIQIDEKTINDIMQELNDVESKELENIMKSDVLKLRKIAANFLQTALEVQTEIKNIEVLMYQQKKIRKQIMNELGVTGRFVKSYETEQYQLNREKIKEELEGDMVEKLYQAAFTFHEEINKILGQEVRTVILLPDESGNPLLFNLTKEQIFDNKILTFEETSKSARLAARFRTNAEKMRSAGIKALEKNQVGNSNLNLNKLNKTYQDVMYRYDNFDRFVLWLYPSKVWNWMRVSARGDIAEAYAFFFLIESEYKFNHNDNKNKEHNIDDFMRNGVANVNNISGLLRGDIESADGSIQYAIKSLNASYMSISQMITLAKTIISSKKEFTVNDLRGYKKSLQTRKQKVRNALKTSLTNQISSDIQEMINKLNQSR